MKNKYGEVTIGYGTDKEKKIPIKDFLQSQFKDNRTISVSQLEDESYIVAVENLVSSGREPQSTIRLSEESLVGMVSTLFIYFGSKGMNFEDLLKKSLENNKDKIDYRFSDNLSKWDSESTKNEE
jgi:hypothetical protein